jgi:hypothetical protein
MSNNNNPLQQFYRTEKLQVKLPSKGKFYDDGVVDLNDDNEVGVQPMTAADEVLFKNPDALLNGKAIKQVIKSCVPSIKKVESLLTNDIDTIIVAIRHASYGDTLDVEATCPECNEDNKFGLSMENTLETSEILEENYPVNLANGLTAFIRPYSFDDSLLAIKKAFEQNNAVKNVESPAFTEEQKMKMLGDSVEVLAKLNFNLIAKCIMRVYKEGESEEDTVDVTDRNHIEDFTKNISREDIHKIQEKLEIINNIGIKKDFNATCSKCEHSWNVPIDFNPATFFTESL